MKVCCCCFNPEIVDKWFDIGEWPNRFITLLDDTPTIEKGTAVSNMIVEKYGFIWIEGQEKQIGHWTTFCGQPLVRPYLLKSQQGFDAREHLEIQGSRIVKYWSKDAQQEFYETFAFFKAENSSARSWQIAYVAFAMCQNGESAEPQATLLAAYIESWRKAIKRKREREELGEWKY